jgi:hypothetical protein
MSKFAILGSAKVGKKSFIQKLCQLQPQKEGTATAVNCCFNSDLFSPASYFLNMNSDPKGNVLSSLEEVDGVFVMIDHRDNYQYENYHSGNKVTSRLTPQIENLVKGNTKPVIMLVNKTDLTPVGEIYTHQYTHLCKHFGFHSWIAISSTSGEGIKGAYETMLKLCGMTPNKESEKMPNSEESKVLLDFIYQMKSMINNPENLVESLRSYYIKLFCYPDKEPLRQLMKSNEKINNLVEGIETLLEADHSFPNELRAKIFATIVKFGKDNL